jgi:hypothetical protein
VGPWFTAVLVDEVALCLIRMESTRLARCPQFLFNRFAEFNVALGHFRPEVAMLKERQNPVDSSGTRFDFVPLGALQGGALSSNACKLPDGFDLE